MNFTQLEYFLLVAECGSFSEAAERAYTSQSSISKQIRALETEMDMDLFVRTTHVPLTEAGRRFIPYARRILDSYDQMCQEIIGMESASGDKLRIASISFMTPYHIADVVAQFMRDYPMVKLNIYEYSPEIQIKMLDEAKLDFGIFYANDQKLNAFDTMCLYKDELVMIANKSHHLVGKKSITLEDLKDETIALMGENVDNVLHAYISNFCRNASFSPKKLPFDGWISSIRMFLEKNLCVTLLPKGIARFYFTEITGDYSIVHFEEHPELDLTLVSRKEKLPSSYLRLAEMLRRHFEHFDG
jgi:DNA-binding transcriptional LysR family regulator